MTDAIAVLDFGSQYTQLITRRVREAGVYCEMFPWDAPAKEVTALQPLGYILSGGPNSVYDPGAPFIPAYVLESGRPVLGICYGMQALTHALGGRVAPAARREYGTAVIEPLGDDPLLGSDQRLVWMSHGDRIESLPPGFVCLASSANSPFAAMGSPAERRYGLQFHPEVKHTPGGEAILRRFVIEICGARPDWTPTSIIQMSIERILRQVGGQRVLAAVSGGVDSSVAAALTHAAVGSQLSGVFVDTGLLRQDERRQVEAGLQQALGLDLHTVDASARFFAGLADVTDPERKRRIIGSTFIDVFAEQARQLGAPPFLVQGTIYPDVVESRASERSKSQRIKTHHNVGGLPDDLPFELVEPLRYLFKDEVRAVGEALGLSHDLVWRQPFPGPGLAVRCLGEVTPDRIERLRQADAIFTAELASAGLLHMLESGEGISGSAQAFAVLLPVQSVGVMGDQRTYQEAVALRAVTTSDFMTADWSHLPFDLLGRVSTRIVNEVAGVNRVVYDITSKPPATIEWE